jgi:hypothetical protein
MLTGTSFFQGYWLKANDNPAVMLFSGEKPFFGVLRDQELGPPLTPAPLAASPDGKAWRLDLVAALAAAKNRAALLYLFTEKTDAARYQGGSKVWSDAEKALVTRTTMPDVEFEPQQALANALSRFPTDAVGNARTIAWDALRKEVEGIYSKFAHHRPGITPILNDRPRAPVIICAPGNPPPWMPPP